MKIASLLLAAVLAVPLAAAGQLPTKEPAKDAGKKGAARAPADAIATVNGVPVPRARLEAMLQQAAARGTPDNEQVREAIKENLINREIVSQEAARQGVAKSPRVQHQLELARQQILIDAFIGDWIRRNPVSDADVEKAYERIKQQQQGGKQYRARHIVVPTEAQAKALIAELKKGASFEELAAKHSTDQDNKDRGGDLDWNAASVFEPPFGQAMVKLQKGELTEAPVQTRYGYHVIRLDDVRDVQIPPLADVKQRLQQQMVQSKVDDMVRGLRAKAKIVD